MLSQAGAAAGRLDRRGELAMPGVEQLRAHQPKPRTGRAAAPAADRSSRPRPA